VTLTYGLRPEDQVVILATGIFVSIVNVFLSLLNLFGRD
jgi:FtsH-binding integral membrane protein